MHYLALATDYDGTLAQDGVVDALTVEALTRLKAAGRRLLLVTGRHLPDLLRVFPQIGLFDCVVAENGALLYWPDSASAQPLGERPPDAFITALRERGVAPLAVGRVIVATVEPHGQTVKDVIRAQNLDLHVILNKGAVMVLPTGINKASGLAHALGELGIASQQVVAVGDAENDADFLGACGLGVAVANALPALKAQAAMVTQGARGAGVIELVEWILANDRNA